MLNLPVGYSKDNIIITVDFHDSRKYFSKIIFQCKCVLLFYFYLFLTVSQKKCLEGGMDVLALLYFATI